jgi:2,4-dienoyl-CoA reductase-like NADH-dependent reductase (Old Yellow Enzyme family)
MASALFQPLTLRDLKVDNRIVVSPMCQYSAVDGSMTDWHLAHLGTLAISGAGLLLFEMTDVEPIGRISYGCSGLYSDDNEAALKRMVAFCRAHGSAKLGIQIAHAGRKASCAPPWEGGRPLREDEGAWQPVAPSPIATDDRAPVPRELAVGEIKALVQKFAQATARAARAGFDTVELHGAHGYLVHAFLSPVSNHRKDEYGGSLENRMRFCLEVFAAMRAAWPPEKPLGIRLSCTDWVEGGWTLEDTLVLARELARLGCDWIDCSSGGASKAQVIPLGPGYQVPFSERVRSETGMTTMAVGLITDFRHADDIVAAGKADMVALARGYLWDARWGWHAARALGAEVTLPPQYRRSAPAR